MGFTLRNIEAADALEIIVGIGAKPGLSGHLMASKITKEIAEFRQLPEGIWFQESLLGTSALRKLGSIVHHVESLLARSWASVRGLTIQTS